MPRPRIYPPGQGPSWAERKAAQTAKLVDRGGRRVSLQLEAEVAAALDRLTARHGTAAAAIVAAILEADRRAATRAESA